MATKCVRRSKILIVYFFICMCQNFNNQFAEILVRTYLCTSYYNYLTLLNSFLRSLHRDPDVFVRLHATRGNAAQRHRLRARRDRHQHHGQGRVHHEPHLCRHHSRHDEHLREAPLRVQRARVHVGGWRLRRVISSAQTIRESR